MRTKALTDILKTEKDPETRKVAVYALEDSDMKDEAVTTLIHVIKNDKNIEVRKAAIRVLGEIGTPKAREALMEVITSYE